MCERKKIIDMKLEIFDDGTMNVEDFGIMDQDVKDYLDVFVKALKMYVQKREEYGDSWKIPEFKNHEAFLTAMVCLVKGKRLCHMLDKGDGVSEKYSNPLKITTLDMINYANFLFQSLGKNE